MPSRHGSSPRPRAERRSGAPVIVTTRLRKGSAYYGRPTVPAAVKGRAKVSVTLRQNTLVQRAITSIPVDAWTTVEYPVAIRDEDTGVWISRAEVAEIPSTAFASAKASQQVPSRLVVRRIPDLNPPADPSRHPCSTSGGSMHSSPPSPKSGRTPSPRTEPTAATPSSSRSSTPFGSALAHLPSGTFNANAPWLILAVIAFTARLGRRDHRRRSTRQGHDRHDPPAQPPPGPCT